jgi:hypothetical protein
VINSMAVAGASRRGTHRAGGLIVLLLICLPNKGCSAKAVSTPRRMTATARAMPLGKGPAASWEFVPAANAALNIGLALCTTLQRTFSSDSLTAAWR